MIRAAAALPRLPVSRPSSESSARAPRSRATRAAAESAAGRRVTRVAARLTAAAPRVDTDLSAGRWARAGTASSRSAKIVARERIGEA
jgi:hypothetical protein